MGGTTRDKLSVVIAHTIIEQQLYIADNKSLTMFIYILRKLSFYESNDIIEATFLFFGKVQRFINFIVKKSIFTNTST